MKRFTLLFILACFAVLRSSAQCDVSAYFLYSDTGTTYSFQDYSSGTDSSTTYLWTFGDGDTSRERDPVHTYAITGGYTICETVTNTDIAHCSNQYCLSISACGIDPGYSYSNSSLYTYNFTNTSTGEDSTTTFFWFFGDGDSSLIQNPSHTYPDTGTYYACLNVYSTAQSCSTEVCKMIRIVCPALANFTYDSSNVYTYHFTDVSTGEDNTSTYLWYFGDGDSSTSRNPVHTYASTGSYSVCLTITNVDQQCDNQYCSIIDIVCPAQAAFTESATGLYLYNFTDISTGEDISTTFAWSFGDGDSSIAKNPVHTFDSLGLYNVCLTLDNVDEHCTSSVCNGVFISCPGSASYSYTVDTNGLTYNFTDLSTGENDSTGFLWNFGDGTTDTAQNPVHTFAQADSFNVCLTITNTGLGCSNRFCSEISVCPLITSFTYTNTNIYTFQFEDASTGETNNVTYLWTFGDGDSSKLKNPKHIFAAQGSYDVSFTVTNTQAGCSNSYNTHIYISCPAVALYTNSISASGYTYSFTDISTGEDSTTTFHWDFGNGDTSKLQNPTITFAATGEYNVCLTINDVDEDCSDQYCSEIDVCPAVALLTYTVTNTLTYHFVDASTGEDASTTYHWDFGDGDTSNQKNPSHKFASLGSYYVCLTVTNNDIHCGNQYCAYITINCPLAPNFTVSDSAIYTARFADISTGEDNTSTFAWTFGDGGNSTEHEPEHTYATTGNYNACLIVTDVDFNCKDTICMDVPVCPSTARFVYAYADSSLFDFQFTDSSSGEDSSCIFAWNFGDGGNSHLQNPEYTFAQAGLHNVCFTLTDTSYNCYTVYCSPVPVDCPDTANFLYYPLSLYGWTFNFEDISVGEDSTTTYAWSFGDGSTATNQLPTHKYDSAGTYSACLVIVNTDLACTSQFCTNVVVACIDTAAFTYTDTGFVYSFLDISVGEDDSVVYLWQFGDNNATSTLQNPVFAFDTSGIHEVCLNIANTDQQCPSQYCTNIDLECPDTSTSFTYNIVDNAYVFIDQSIGEIDSVSYLWDFGDNQTSTASEPAHAYSAVGEYLICMTINQKSIKCVSEFCDSLQVTVTSIRQISAQEVIKLYPNPTAGNVNIDMNGLSADEIRIFNNLGQEVQYLAPRQSGIIPVDVNGLPAGMYTVQVTTVSGGVANIKMVVAY